MIRESENPANFQETEKLISEDNAKHSKEEGAIDIRKDEKIYKEAREQNTKEICAILMRSKIIQNTKEFQTLLEDENAKYVLEHAEAENIDHFVGFLEIKTREQFLDLCGDEVAKYVLEYAKAENIEYIFGLFQIKTLKLFQNLYKNNYEFENVLVACKLNNIKYVIEGKFKITPQQLLEYSNSENFFDFLSSADLKITEYLINRFEIEDFEKFKKFYTEWLGTVEIKNVEFICNRFSIKTIEQFYDLYKINAVVEVLVFAKLENLEYFFTIFDIKTPEQFVETCKNKNIVDNLDKAKTENLKYLLENGIVSTSNLFHLNSRVVNSSVLLDIKQENSKENNFIKKLINKYPRSASDAIAIIADSKEEKEKNEDEKLDIIKDQKDIFDILDRLGNITPFIFDKFRKLNSDEREDYIKKINEAKKEIFKNKPINLEKNSDEMAELIYLAYEPVGMDYSEVKEYLSELTDNTDHLKDYKFPEDGYDIEINNLTEKILKKEEQLDFENINGIFEAINNSVQKKEDGQEGNDREISIVLGNIAKAAPSLKDSDFSGVLGLIKDENLSSFAEKRFSKYDLNGVYNYLSEAKKIIETVFKNNAENSVREFLKQNPENAAIIKSALENHQKPFLKSLGGKFKDSRICSDDYWNNLDVDKASNLLAVFANKKIAAGFIKRIDKELNKIEDKEKISQTSRKKKEKVKMKAYISKNVASFFAKASTGICTEGDVNLFNRKDHFHINLVEKQENEDEIMRGNVQAYIIDEENGEKSLLLRGVNPCSDFLYEVDVGSLCDEIIKIGKRFAKDNNFKEVYLSEQRGYLPKEERFINYISLSDRKRVYEYLEKEYLKEEKKKNLEFEIVDRVKVSHVYAA